MNTVQSLKCKNCNKEYQRQSAFDKHKLLCSGGDPHAPLTTLNCGGGLGGLPKSEAGGLGGLPKSEAGGLGCLPKSEAGGLGGLPLKDIVMELVKSNQKLRKDVEELKRWVQTKKKKIIIVDWLNINCKPTENYKEFISKLCIARPQLEIVFNSNIIDGIQEILQDFMNSPDTENIPFKSFDQKDNTIYVYNEESKWEHLSSTEFNNIISSITKNILSEFKNWQDENGHQLYTEDFSVLYIQNVKKVMGGDISIDKQRNKIHRNLYKYLKMNLQNTIEYEFQ